MSVAFPGFDSPAAGFELPFEMLAACHDRVRRSLALLARLVSHVQNHGHDASSRSAAADVLRYFDLAAPLHHQDEERHVFPLFTAGVAGAAEDRDADADVELRLAVAGLRRDHARMEALWAGLRVTLADWAPPTAAGRPDAGWLGQASAFGDPYVAHLQVEESAVFPAARSRISGAALAAMSKDMAQRRTNPEPP